MTYTDILYEVTDPYAVITLKRPDQLNAFTYNTLAEFRSAIDSANATSSARRHILCFLG